MRNPSTKKAMNSATSSAAAAATTATSSTPCCSKVGLKRGPWTPEEDELLSNYIKKEGEGKWRTLPKKAGLLRCGKSCRLRWMNYLRPNVKRGQISSDEEDLILRLHRLLGNRWSLIAGRIPGRTDNEIKNYWNTHLSKKLISQGIDPRTHKPLNYSSSSTTTFAHHHRHHQAAKLASLSSSSTRVKRNNASSSSTSEKKDPNYEDNDDDNNKDIHNEDPMLIINKNRENNDINNGLFYNTLLDDRYQTIDGYTSLPLNCDDDHYPRVMAMERNNINSNSNNNNISSGKNYHQGPGNEEDEDMNNYCNNEDVFSSFLNSLINEDDDFTTTQHQSAESLLNAINASNLGFESDWQESSFISPSLNNKFNDFKRVGNDDNVEE